MGTPGSELALGDTIRRRLDGLIAASQQRFRAAAVDAMAAVRGLSPLIALVTPASVPAVRGGDGHA